MRKKKPDLTAYTPSLFPEQEERVGADLPHVVPSAPTFEEAFLPHLVSPDPLSSSRRPSTSPKEGRPGDLLASLNAPQRQAVTTTEGPVLVLAGPGSGKTRVITYRIAYLVQRSNIPPHAILAVTFTNKAAREMRGRLEDLVGVAAAGQMVVGTFHAISARLLRRAPAFLVELGLTPSFHIMDGDDAMRVMREAMRRMQHELAALGENEDARTPGALLDLISSAKNRMIGPDRMEQDATNYREVVLAALYRRYQQLLRVSNGVDFDDLLLFAEYLMRSDGETRARYQQRWSYLHVDEFQDCNLPQYKLVRLLAFGTDEQHGGLGNLCVVGDDDQMIYTWRGASVENIGRYLTDFPQARTVVLEQNYRSTQVILDAAQGVVQPIKDRRPKRLWTANAAGNALRLVATRDEDAEGRFIAQEIRRLHDQGAAWQQIAVLYRANAQSRAIEEALLQAAVPYVVSGSRSFYERKEVKDVLAYLRLLANPCDDVSFERVVNVPPRKIGAKTLTGLKVLAEQQERSLLDVCARAYEHPALSKAARQALVQFAQLVARLARELGKRCLSELIDLVLSESGYEAYLKKGSQEEQERWSNLLELRRVGQTYDGIDPRPALEAFLDYIALVGGSDITQTGEQGTPIDPGGKDAVTLMTLHAAKGLEYQVVFIAGLDDGSLPHSRSFDSRERLEEERRLLYVGITRSMRLLYLVRAQRRLLFGRVVQSTPSRFLADVPPHVLSS